MMKGTLANRMEDALSWLERRNRPGLGFASWIVLLVHTVAVARTASTLAPGEGLQARHLLVVALSYVTVLAMGELLHVVLARQRVLLFLTSSFYIGSYCWLLGYAFVTHQSLEWHLIRDNLAETFYKESLLLIFAWPAPIAILVTAGFVGLGMVLEWRFRFVTRWPGPVDRGLAGVAWAVVYAVAFFQPMYSGDEATYFLQTVWRYVDKLPPSDYALPAQVAGLDTAAPFPLVHPGAPPQHPPARPHVFLVAMESYNADFLGRSTPDGRPITPVLNEHLKQGISVPRFYGNAVQTARGHISIFCSLVDSFQRKISTGHPELNLHCLPAVLRDQGWRTYFFSASRDLEFDQAGVFMGRAGFQHRQAMDPEFLGPDQEQFMHTWGLRDDVFFSNVFRALDAQHAQDQAHPEDPAAAQPLFVGMATITHHNPFYPPEGSPLLYPDPQEYTQRFVNSLHTADSYLATFFAELERRPWLQDSLVILTADHSFPGGERGNRFNQVGIAEDHFHAPLVLLWKGHLQPGEVTDAPFSQLDIAPTVLDLLGIQASTHFLGRSLFSPDRTPALIPLVQPYDGKHLGLVRGHYKYAKHLRTQREYLFDLAADPLEKVNLVDRKDLADTLAQMRRDLGLVYLNQRVIDENRVWPAQ